MNQRLIHEWTRVFTNEQQFMNHPSLRINWHKSSFSLPFTTIADTCDTISRLVQIALSGYEFHVLYKNRVQQQHHLSVHRFRMLVLIPNLTPAVNKIPHPALRRMRYRHTLLIRLPSVQKFHSAHPLEHTSQKRVYQRILCHRRNGIDKKHAKET